MKNLVLHVALLVVSLMLVPLAGWGQGWERVYNFGGDEIGIKSIETQDSNFIVAALQDAGEPNMAFRLSKMDRLGNLIWSKIFTTEVVIPALLHQQADETIILITYGYEQGGSDPLTYFWLLSKTGDLIQRKTLDLPDTQGSWAYDVDLNQGDIFLSGFWRFGSHLNPFISKVSLQGNLLWHRKLDYFPSNGSSNDDEVLTDIEHDNDGNFWAIHSYQNGWRLLKLDDAADTIVVIPLPGGSNVYQYKIKMLDSCLMICGAIRDGQNFNSFVKKIDKQGNVLKTVDFTLPFCAEQPVLCRTKNGGIALLNYTLPFWPGHNYSDISLISFDQDLNWVWDKQYYKGSTRNIGYDLIETASNGFLITGETFNLGSNLYLILTDSLGNSITNLIAGKVQWDQDKDCIGQPSDPGLKNWIVSATSATDTFYRNTAIDGSYALRVDTGHYTVRVRPLNSLWDADCMVLDTVLTQMFDTIQQHFPVRAIVDCPGMEVSTAVARLRPCFPANLQVWYCNNGTITAEDAQIQVILNEHMTYDSASLAPSLVSGDTVWFTLGDVPPFECGNFYIRVQVDCDTTLLGQTLCYTAHAFPDTTCLSPAEWSGAQVVATGYCEGDSIRLVLRNIGSAPTTNGLEYIIVEDNVILIQAPFGLPAGDSIVLKVAANGSTWRLIAQQEPGFPNGFFTTVALEGCHAGANFSTGFVNQFPGGHAAPWLDEECRSVTGSYDPNDKSAVPEGYGEQHFVAANTELEYLIRFQNTGTDTAFRVVIRDQISPLLDPASVQPGAASHPYTWSLSRSGELSFTFDPIALPDSNINLIASQGFVQFRIAQQANLPSDTRFENRAAIYFDFNAPVVTNTVFHTVQPLFKQTSGVASPVFAKGERLKIWPNPAADVAYISFKDNAVSPRKLSLYDLNGQLIAVTYSRDKTIAVQRGNLPAAVFLIKIETAGERTQVGTVVFR